MTEYISLVIKGNKLEATRACREHGININIITPNENETQIRVDTAYLSEVFEWFLEPVEYPYPAGTLLHYCVHRDGERGFGIGFGREAKENT